MRPRVLSNREQLQRRINSIMPGAYAHITATKHLLSGNYLDGIDMPNAAKEALSGHNEFCILGSVSPDYPYLVLGVPGSSYAHEWADEMHTNKVGNLLRFGVHRIKDMPPGEEHDKCLAWFLGVISHVGMDMTIHPVVEKIAGIYSESKENQKKHRICEMHQDVHIWQRMGLGTVGRGESIDVIRDCSNSPEDSNLYDALRILWEGMLYDTYPELYERNIPDINLWHKMFPFIVDKVEESHKFPRFARHVSSEAGFSYPIPEEVREEYIKNLKAPGHEPQNYGEIFDQALSNVSELWSLISKAILEDKTEGLSKLGEWNLDRGLDGSGNYVFWS